MDPRLRHRVLCDWVGGSYPRPEIRGPANLQNVFQKAFSSLRLQHRFEDGTLLEHWPTLVGPTLSAHCFPRGVKKGVLMVTVDHPAWLHQITLAHKTDILQAVQKAFPNLRVQDISLKIA
jgi:predicted nucleic acid-binding Zn ribbon protein